MSVILTFYFGLGLIGIWLGISLGLGGFVALQITCLMLSSWKELCKLIKKELEEQEKRAIIQALSQDTEKDVLETKLI